MVNSSTRNPTPLRLTCVAVLFLLFSSSFNHLLTCGDVWRIEGKKKEGKGSIFVFFFFGREKKTFLYMGMNFLNSEFLMGFLFFVFHSLFQVPILAGSMMDGK